MFKVQFEEYNDVEEYATLEEAQARVLYFDEIEYEGFCWIA